MLKERRPSGRWPSEDRGQSSWPREEKSGSFGADDWHRHRSSTRKALALSRGELRERMFVIVIVTLVHVLEVVRVPISRVRRRRQVLQCNMDRYER